MPMNLQQLHESLAPTSVFRFENAPDDSAPSERQMFVWKDIERNEWHFKTKIFELSYEGLFERQADARVISKLDSSKVFGDITELLGERLAQTGRPYLKLSVSQQGTILAALQGLDVFSETEDRVTRQVASSSILNQIPKARHESEMLQTLRDYLTEERLNLMGGAADTFLATRRDTSLADMLNFIYFLLGACQKDLNPSIRIRLPEPPAWSMQVYQGPPSNPNPDMLGALDGFLGGDFSNSQYILFTPEQLGGMFRQFVASQPRTISKITVACDAFELLLHDVETAIPREALETEIKHKDCFLEMREAVRVFLESSRELSDLLKFRASGERFIQNPIIQRYHTRDSFWGKSDTDALSALKHGLNDLREHSQIHQMIRSETTWSAMFFGEQALDTIFAPSFMASFYCIMMNGTLYPLCVLIGFTLPFLAHLIHSVYLASYLWEMPYEAVKDYMEATENLWSRIPLLWGMSALGGVFVALGHALLIAGTEVSVAVSTWLAISLISATLAWVLPILCVAVGRGLYEGVEVLCSLISEDEEESSMKLAA